MYEVSKGKQIVFKRKMEIKQKYSAGNGILYQTKRNEPEINFPTYVYFTFIYENKRFCTYSKLIGKFLLSCFRLTVVFYISNEDTIYYLEYNGHHFLLQLWLHHKIFEYFLHNTGFHLLQIFEHSFIFRSLFFYEKSRPSGANCFI